MPTPTPNTTQASGNNAHVLLSLPSFSLKTRPKKNWIIIYLLKIVTSRRL